MICFKLIPRFINWKFSNQFRAPFRLLKMSDSNPGNGFFSMGLKTQSVPMEMFAENRRRLCQRLRGAQGVSEGAVILLQGGGDQVICHQREGG